MILRGQLRGKIGRRRFTRPPQTVFLLCEKTQEGRVRHRVGSSFVVLAVLNGTPVG
jgi:hypothetical protein